MIIKFFKWVFLMILALIILIFAGYYGFKGWEHLTGARYVQFLEENSETVAIDSDFTFATMQSDIENASLILVGEVHGFEEPCKFDVEFFKHLYRIHGVRNYVAELDPVQALWINRYLESGNESYLDAALKNWAVVQGKFSKDYRDKYRNFRTFYPSLADEEKFYFYGIDMIQDWNLTSRYLNELIQGISNDTAEIGSDPQQNVKLLLELISMNDTILEDEDYLMYSLISENVRWLDDKAGRERILFQNFKYQYEARSWSDEKLYSFLGLYHVMQYKVNGKDPFAAQVRQSELGLNEKILSLNFNFVDSYMIMDSKMLPEFLRTGEEFTKVPFSADNVLFMYTIGSGDFKRVTSENEKSIFRLIGEDSPYQDGNRLTQSIKILPFVEDWEFSEPGEPYTQYTVFVRNSDWAEPEI